MPYFPIPRLSDITLARAATENPLAEFPLDTGGAHELVADDGLALFTFHNARVLTPDDAASFLWLNATQGVGPDSIANSLTELTGKGMISDTEAKAIRKDVWASLSDWGQEGLLRPRIDGADAVATPDMPKHSAWIGRDTISWCGGVVELRLGAEEIPARIESVLAPLRTTIGDATRCINILTETSGYAISDGGRLWRRGLKLTQIADALASLLLGDHTDQSAICLAAAFCTHNDEHAVLFASSARGGWDALALSFAALTGSALGGGVTALERRAIKWRPVYRHDGATRKESIASSDPGLAPDAIDAAAGKATPIALPLRISAKDNTKDHTPSTIIQRWNKGRGVFVPCAEQITEIPSKTITAIIIPKMDEDHNGTAQLEPLSERDGFKALNAMRRHEGGAFSHQRVENFFAWRRSVAIFEISFSDPAKAAHSCAAQLRSGFFQPNE